MDNSHCGLRGITDNSQFTKALSVRAASVCDSTGRSKVMHSDRARQTQQKQKGLELTSTADHK